MQQLIAAIEIATHAGRALNVVSSRRQEVRDNPYSWIRSWGFFTELLRLTRHRSARGGRLRSLVSAAGR